MRYSTLPPTLLTSNVLVPTLVNVWILKRPEVVLLPPVALKVAFKLPPLR
jgi:hypothetical protein